MKMIKSTGLVPVMFLTAMLPYREGQVAGVLPDVARKLLASKEAEIVDPPKDVETVDLDGSAPADPAPAAEVADVKVVEIPEDWRDMHHMKRAALAKALGGDPQNAEEAIAIIEAEVAKRAAA